MHSITAFDTAILWWIQEYIASPLMDVIMPAITHLGDAGAIWVIITLALLLRKETRMWGISMFIALAICFVAGNLLLKPWIARLRPCHILELPLLIAIPSDFSFPSGHTMSSFASAAVLYYYNKLWGKIGLGLAALIAFSRLYLFVHYPSDIAAGVVLGLLAGWLACKLTKLLSLQKNL